MLFLPCVWGTGKGRFAAVTASNARGFKIVMLELMRFATPAHLPPWLHYGWSEWTDANLSSLYPLNSKSFWLCGVVLLSRKERTTGQIKCKRSPLYSLGYRQMVSAREDWSILVRDVFLDISPMILSEGFTVLFAVFLLSLPDAEGFHECTYFIVLVAGVFVNVLTYRTSACFQCRG